MSRAIREIGAALRATKCRRRRIARCAVLIALGAAVLAATVAMPPAPRLVWNASASAPVGLYHVMPGKQPAPGDMVLAWPPLPGRQLAARRGYLPLNVPLLKHVAAGPGDRVCSIGRDLLVNGAWVAARRDRDPKGRLLPRWTGCRTLGAGDYLLLSSHPGSFDGRYFGVSRVRDIIGPARLLWRR